ncbi:shikimate kinase AroL [Halodesulfovibrio marinisediminis]|uniref:Shikimate kinase n=1 Tax=Halodesulfovibrio marinisediminis DSM 17456 TaxID=1121457 RepID=A0A1N6IK63_9BACT|nr:shikimate kinase AroL [Halodesulfovibrio marinisediminis]SIO32376.1 shikimate kinase [Halodesulfovibrio marinisediminis DSM 17456]
MEYSKRVYLIGSRGCGKTSVGVGLARRLKSRFTDTDALLCEMQGKSVADIVEAEGWDVFRDYESAALIKATEGDTLVIATGGGMVLREQNRSFMREHGVVVFIDVPPAELARRLSVDPLDKQRPSLTGKSLIDEIAEVLAERMHLYMESAQITVDGTQTVEEIIDNIVELLETKPDS